MYSYVTNVVTTDVIHESCIPTYHAFSARLGTRIDYIRLAPTDLHLRTNLPERSDIFQSISLATVLDIVPALDT